MRSKIANYCCVELISHPHGFFTAVTSQSGCKVQFRRLDFHQLDSMNFTRHTHVRFVIRFIAFSGDSMAKNKVLMFGIALVLLFVFC